MRRPLVVGNWKMNGTKQSVAELLDGLLARWQGVHRAEVAVCAPYVHLYQVARQLAESNIHFGAQDVSQYDNGAYTGDISAAMLSDMFCHFVIVGHSERRQYYSEGNRLVAKKFAVAVAAKLTPILCIGESLAQREADDTLEVISEQLHAVIDQVGVDKFTHAIVAYEPVWAIGTGRTATPEQAQEVHRFIRQQLGDVGAATRIIYGGSVKRSNAVELFRQPDIDGGLIGGASLDPAEFTVICQAAELPSD
ncbi:MAG: triose-phosphate isomerase [Cellvibrionaceae bacterium]